MIKNKWIALTIFACYFINQIRTDDFQSPVYRRICYFASWAVKRHENISRLMPEEIDPFLCTHINYAFGRVADTLTIVPYEGDESNNWAGNAGGMYKRVLKLKKKNPDLRILLSVGGWTHGSKGFNEVTKTDNNIKTFAKNSIRFLRTHKFDGLDIDWEYPGAKDQGAESHTKTGFTDLVKELSQAFERDAEKTKKEKLLLTSATAAARHRIEAGYEVEEICKYFDFVSVMTYDYHGGWDGKTGHNSPLYGMRKEKKQFREWNVNNSMHLWTRLGCPKDKLNMGLAAYGRAFNLDDDISISNITSWFRKRHKIGVKASTAEAGRYTQEAGILAYYEICELILENPKNRVRWHREMSVPYVLSDSLWIGFDNVESVTLKMKFLKDQGYGGVIIWSLDLDDKIGDVCKEGPFPLINAVKRELLNVPKSSSSTTTKQFNRETNSTNSPMIAHRRSNAQQITHKLIFYFLCLFFLLF